MLVPSSFDQNALGCCSKCEIGLDYKEVKILYPDWEMLVWSLHHSCRPTSRSCMYYLISTIENNIMNFSIGELHGFVVVCVNKI